jgi:hypothetical protein
MKKLINYTFITAIFAMIFVFASCTNPLIDADLGNGGEGSFALQVAVPNYDLHFTQDVSAQAVAPNSNIMAVYFDETIATPQEWPQYENDLYNRDGATNESNGFFYTLYEAPIDVKAGFYQRVRVELRSDWGGDAITSGEAYDVTVAAWPAEPTEVHISLTPPEGMFTELVVGTPLTGQMVDFEGMKFYSFDAAAYTGYSLTIDPLIDGEPDVYLFNSEGLRTGLDLGHDIISTADPDGLLWPGLDTTMSIYRDIDPQTYYLGVYGWRSSADFNLTLAVDGDATYRPAPPTPPDPTEVELLVDDAIGALNNPDGTPDFDLALQLFTDAHLADPGYGPAFAGYNALSAMTMMTDPDIVFVAREVLGMQDYATSLTELFNGEWLQVYTTPEGWDDIFPRIIDQHLKDGAVDGMPDGIIDPYERLLAFMDYFIHHSDGFGILADLALGKLGDRLDFVVQQIMAMDPEMSMTFTWDMIFEDFERDVVNYEPNMYGSDWVSYKWPVDEHGSPVAIKVGKAELLALTSVLKILESFINIGMAYEYNFVDGTETNVLVDYWTDFNPVDGTGEISGIYESTVTPFETGFLMPRDTALLSIEAARFSFLDALDILQNAIFEMQTDRPDGFAISSTSPLPGIGGIDWGHTLDVLAFENIAIMEARDSVNNIEDPLFVPIYFDEMMGIDFGYYAYGNWPMEIIPGDSIGVNLGVFFENPMAFILELGPDGEPVWYDFAPYSYFAPIASIDPQFGGGAYGRITDLTLGGIVPVENFQYIPVDDPNTRARLDGWDWDDWGTGMPEYNGNGMWDPGEEIWWADIGPAVEGVIDIFNQNIDILYPMADPLMWYDVVDAYALTDVDLMDVWEVAPENYGFFREALNMSSGFYIWDGGPLIFLDDVSLFFPAPAELVWNSLSDAGDTGFNEWGDPIVSAGSVYWAVLNQIYNMGGPNP